jgi:hypothetical protein
MKALYTIMFKNVRQVRSRLRVSWPPLGRQVLAGASCTVGSVGGRLPAWPTIHAAFSVALKILKAEGFVR